MMAYFPDLGPATYWSYSQEEVLCGFPLLAVGWLEPPHEIPTGSAPPGFAERLLAFCASEYVVAETAGRQLCGYCGVDVYPEGRQRGLLLGNGEIRVLGSGVAYAAPTMIHHYVTAHGYLPPPEFVSAVLNGAQPDDIALKTYRYHWWEDAIAAATRHPASKNYRPGLPPARPGSVLGPLVWYFRGLLVLIWGAGGVIMLHPGGVLMTVSLLLVLGALGALVVHRLRCPVCFRRMRMFRRAQKGQPRKNGSPCDLYCDHCGIGIRVGSFWGPPRPAVETD